MHFTVGAYNSYQHIYGKSIRITNSQKIRETAEILHRTVQDVKKLVAIPLGVGNPDREIKRVGIW